MHAIEYKYAQSSFDNIWTINATRQINHDLRNNKLSNLSLIRFKLFRKIPLYSIPHEWNNDGNIIFHRIKHSLEIFLEKSLWMKIDV